MLLKAQTKSHIFLSWGIFVKLLWELEFEKQAL